jgi:hypothetical protein
VIPVGIAKVVSIVLDEEDFGSTVKLTQRCQYDPLARRLLSHQTAKRPALGRRVLEVAGVDVQSAAIE